MNFLIDECLHTSLVEVAQARGHEATHVNYRGLSGVQDWNLIPNVPPDQQRILFDAALDDVLGEGGLINEALEVAIIDGAIEITRYELPDALG